MKTTATIVGLALLTSCTSLDIDSARFSAGASALQATAEVEDNAGTRSNTADSDRTKVNLELTNVQEDGLEVGLLLGFSEGDVGEVESTNYDIGAAARQFFTEGTLRPYVEGRIGYRRAELYDPVLFGKGASDMLLLGAGAGVQLDITESLGLFVQGNYDYAHGDRFSTDGFGVTFGGTVSF